MVPMLTQLTATRTEHSLLQLMIMGVCAFTNTHALKTLKNVGESQVIQNMLRDADFMKMKWTKVMNALSLLVEWIDVTFSGSLWSTSLSDKDLT
jgi:hypothetical protein